ncbi:MAG: carbamoyltransferase HypF, partial [Epsilonproteobacteria bacterium]|nr:carbamoyltransferase HypF [Campylobacterota bacterium]
MIRYRFLIKGVVQGVGFRPFIYKIATKLDLKGFVLNSSNGVIVELEGEERKIDEFEELLFSNLPPLAKIDSVTKEAIKIKRSKEFKILKSIKSAKKTTLVPADIKVCKECLEDIKNPNSRFFRYFATNCTNCGPRYSIIKSLPYDRENSSMAKFKMCKECKSEYNNPLSRRYHAQPIACKNCGPKLRLIVGKESFFEKDLDIYFKVAKLIKSGKIGAIKGVGGFHIVCDATNFDAIKKLREYKNRPTKPFAIMCKDINQIKKFAFVDKKEEELLLSKEAPIVILKRKNKAILSDLIAPNIDRVGCFLPYTPLHFLLFEHLETPIVATSANLGGEPIIKDINELKERLLFLDFIVDFNRDIVNGIDDSLLQIVDNEVQMLRLGRGFAPKVLKLPKKIDKNILAFGANQKATIAIAFEDNLILSPYIGDLDNIKTINFFKQTIETFKRFYDFRADILVADLHPNYESSKLAKEIAKKQNLKLFTIQHHLAHLNSVKAEFGLEEEFISFIFDGTGFGDDGLLWGGEVFIGDKRKYHFKPIKLIGGEKAIKEPRRVALALLFEKFSLEEILELNLPTIKAFSKAEIKMLYQAWQKNLNSPLSS